MNATQTILILIPTRFEFDIISPKLELTSQTKVELCGFGPTIPAARTAQLIAQFQLKRIVLVGIAGGLGRYLKIGSAYSFSKVSCFGVGAGEAALHESAQEMGWPFWAGASEGENVDESQAIGSTLDLAEFNGTKQSVKFHGLELLTVCSASASEAEVARRCDMFPNAVAEDMEGFAVAAAAKLSGCSLSIVRGISNQAGDRNKKNWEVGAALEAAAVKVNELLREPT